MERTYWHKQTKDKPLFPDLLWSRPENRAHAGKLLIVGGNAMGFSAPAEAYSESLKAGAGSTRVLLPQSIKKELPPAFHEAEFAPNTPSGSFAQSALGELTSAAEWADGVLLAGDFGRNSETAILLEKFVQKYEGQVTVVGDTIDYFFTLAPEILNRTNTTVVVDMSRLQKLAAGAKFPKPFTSALDFLHVVDLLHEFSEVSAANIVLVHEKTVFVAVRGEVATTQFENLPHQTKIAAHTSVWWLQNPLKTFESLTTSLALL
ncbi:MAG TPA: hypothetical protein VLG13_00635 [Patescibacteria group bacterium]|nr:hypothetical protein [Patescibacteria group bacterium]